MSSDNIYLSKKELDFLRKMLELTDPQDVADKFALLMVQEGANPLEIQKYLKKIMDKMKKDDK